MKKSNLKIISLVLVFLMVFCTIPTTAVGVQDNYYDVSKSFGEMENIIPEPEIVPNPDYVQGENTGEIVEIIDRREENVKHFRLEDGSARAIVYSYAVHRKDENGVWQDIDNRLFKNQNGYYSTSENRVSFAGNANDKSLFTLKENGYVISMGLVTSEESIKSNEVLLNKSLPLDEQLLSESKKITADEKLEKLSKIDNKTNILYKRVANGVDLSYTLQANEIKEYIVVNSPQNEYVYNFTLQLDGLVAQLMENGSVVLYDELTKEDEYYIPAPYMFDAKGERSTDVHYKLNDLDNGQYTLTVIADTDWVNNNSRVFPVMIDPTLQQKILYDTYINSSEPGTNYGTSSELWVSSSKISYIRANLTSIPSGSEINFATFNAAYYYYSHITDGTLNVGVYQVEKSWTERGLTWNSASQYSNQGISTTRLSYRTLRGDAGAYQSSPKWQSFVITDAVNSWFNGSPNHGVALKRESGTNGSVIICSYEFGIDYRPYFIIFYKEPVITQGVYRLKNAYNGLYLTTGGTSYKTGAPIQQSASKGSNDLTQLFKITYIQDYSNDRYYDIRPMTNSALGLYAPLASSSTHTVTANSMATTDGWYDIPQTQRWTIQTNASGGYVTLLNAFSDNGGYLATPSNSTNGAAISTTTTLSANCRWILERYTGEKIDSVKMTSFKSSVECGQSFTYTAYMYDDQIGVNGPVTYRVGNNDYSATDKAAINETTGELTALKCGAIKIGVTYSGAPWIWWWKINITPIYSYKVVHYYDEGYNIRFANASQNIKSYQDICSAVFLYIFSIDVETDIINYSSCADNCKGIVAIGNLTNSCTHSVSHLSTGALRTHIISQYGNGSNILTRVVWSGHLLDNNPSSNSSSYSHTVVMTIRHTTDENHNNRSDAVIRYQSIFTLLHETSHQLGAPDHYCYGNNSNGPTNPCNNPTGDCWRCNNALSEPPNCVMTYRNDKIEEKLQNGTLNDLYCSQCTGTGSKSIPNHLANHH